MIAVLAPIATLGETIYAFSRDFGWNVDHRLLRFDSASPWELEASIPINGDIADSMQVSLEFDPVTRELFAFGFDQCQVLCPAIATYPMRIDPTTGELEYLDWPGLPPIEFGPSDKDIDPQTRELRLFSQAGGNYRYSIESLEVHEDQPLSVPGYAYAIAHRRAASPGGDVETFAIFDLYDIGQRLVRIGGVDGLPPASSGEVTVIGPVETQGDVLSFDISSSGEAFLATYEYVQDPDPGGSAHVTRLYRIDLASGATQELGIIPTQLGSYVSGIAVAPPGLGAGAPEIPVLSPTGLVALSLFLAAAALWRTRTSSI